jgi:protocatechuate 3,4-dioxygenase beta subunit
MRLNVAITGSVLTLALTGSTAIGQVVFTPAQGGANVFIPPQGGVPAPAGPGAVPPRDRSRTATKGTASIRGRVTAAGTTTPLRRAQVAVFSSEGLGRFTTTTNGEGRFEVLELPAGRYTITVTKGGYVSLQYGQRRPFEPGTSVAVADGQALTGLDLALPRGSVIAGRITDEFGEPVASAQVSAQRYQYGPDGQRRLASSGTVTTDDLGQFRLHSLMPGEYIVSATFRSNFIAIGGAIGGSDTSESFLPTFHPGTINVSEAQPVTVTLGQESSVQFALSAARIARVSGLVVDSTGRPLISAMVALLPSSGQLSVSGLNTAQSGPDGSFTFPNVAPGDYVANVQLVPGLSNSNIPESAAVRVSVGGSDLNGLRIATGPGVLISGVVEFEGTASRTAPTPWRVFTQASVPAQVTFSAGNAQANGLVGDDGSFQLAVSGVGGALIRTTTTPQWTLKAVTLDGEDVTDTPLDFSGKGALSGLRIVLTDKLTTVSGRVIDARGKPLSDYAVVIQPEDAKTGVVATRYLRVLRPDQNGGFRVTGLPPGRYAATAVETFEQGRQFVPEVQARLKTRGRMFSIDEGGTAALDLSLATGVD